jgi:Zn-dependent protease with chaperone function
MIGGIWSLFPLFLIVVVWVALGAVLGWIYRRSQPRLLLRISALFLGLWGLFVTTLLAWVVLGGGTTAAWDLVESPGRIFAIESWRFWTLGALGTFAVFTTAFTLNQVVAYGLLRLTQPEPVPWPARLGAPPPSLSLLSFRSGRYEAFSFAIVSWEREGSRGPRPRRRDVILVSRSILEDFPPEEVEAVIAHELGHVRALDGRYLTYVRTLSSLMRADPLLAWLARLLTRREEIRADQEAVARTAQPLPLARALFKATFTHPSRPAEVSDFDPEPPAPFEPWWARAFVGRSPAAGGRDVLDRIERLLEMAGRSPP